MKLKNILSTLVILFFAVACSSEDVLNDRSNETTSKPEETTNKEAYLTFSLNTPGVTTRSESFAPTPEEEKINNCSLLLFDGDNVLFAQDNIGVDQNNNLISNGTALSLLTKVRSGLSIMVIANSSVEFASCQNRDAVNNTVITDDPDALVKVGEAEVLFTDYPGYPSTTQAMANPYLVTVNLRQVAARIELVKIIPNIINNINNEKIDFSLESSMLFKQKRDSYLENETKNHNFGDEVDMKGPSNSTVAYSYANTNTNNLTTIKITGRAQNANANIEKEYVRDIVINRPGTTQDHIYVKGGYTYRLIVTVTIDARDLSIAATTVECSVKDWNAPIDISGEMVEQ